MFLNRLDTFKKFYLGTGPGAWYQSSAGAAPTVGVLPVSYAPAETSQGPFLQYSPLSRQRGSVRPFTVSGSATISTGANNSNVPGGWAWSCSGTGSQATSATFAGLIPVDTTKSYYGRVWIANTVNTTQTAFVGFACYDETGASLGNRYFMTGATGVAPGSGGVWYSGVITGTAASGNTFFATGTKFVQIFALLGNGSPTGAWTTVFSTPETNEVTPLQYGGTGANLSATGGTSQIVKQSGVGAAFTVGTLTPTEVLTNFTGTKSSDFVARGDGTMAKAVTADWSVGNHLNFTTATGTLSNATRQLVPSSGGLILNTPGKFYVYLGSTTATSFYEFTESGLTFTTARTGTPQACNIGREDITGNMRFNVAFNADYYFGHNGTTTFLTLNAALLNSQATNGLYFNGAAGSVTSGNRQIAPTSTGLRYNVPTTLGHYWSVAATDVASLTASLYTLITSNGMAYSGTQTLSANATTASWRDSGGNFSVNGGTSGGLAVYNNGTLYEGMGQNGLAFYGTQASIGTGVTSIRRDSAGSMISNVPNSALHIGQVNGSQVYNIGASNTFAGYVAGNSTSTSVQNAFYGYAAGTNVVSGSYLTAIGGYAMGSGAVTGSNYSVGVGYQTLYSLTSGAANIGIGYAAGAIITTPSNNICIGQATISSGGSQPGDGNIAIGANASRYLASSAAYNTVVGFGAHNAAGGSTGGYNALFGYTAGVGLTSAIGCSFFGAYAGSTSTTQSYATAVGYGALGRTGTNTGTELTAVGNFALGANTSGNYSTALGFKAGYANTTGSENVYVGDNAGIATTTGSYNTHVGTSAAYTNTTGSRQVAIGRQAGFLGSVNDGTVSIGYQAGYSNTVTGSVYVGDQAGKNSDGTAMVCIGTYAGFSNSVGSYNTYLGHQSGYTGTTGYYNTYVGANAGYATTTGHLNTLVGTASGYNITTGVACTAVGNDALHNSSTDNYNTAVGDSALYYTSGGAGNTAVGNSAGYSNVSGPENTYVGFSAAIWNNGSYNTIVGWQAGRGDTAGATYAYCVAVGHSSLYYATNTVGNTAVGNSALQGTTSGQYNTAVGYLAGAYGTTAGGNVYIGREAGLNCNADLNVFVGVQAGLVVVNGAGNTCVGAGAGQGDFSDCTYIGNQAGGYSSGTASGVNNSCVGAYALNSLTTASSVNAFGYSAGANISTATQANAFGNVALGSHTTGGYSDAFGYCALYLNVTGVDNAAFGNQALAHFTGSYATAFGAASATNLTTGARASAFGFYSAANASTADDLSAFGAYALQNLTTGGANSAFGSYALSSVTTSAGNVAFGASAGFYATGAWNALFGTSSGQALTTGSYNTLLGCNGVGGSSLTTGSYCVTLGYNCDVLTATGSYQVNLANLVKRDSNGALFFYKGTTSPSEIWQVTSDGKMRWQFNDSVALSANTAYAIGQAGSTIVGEWMLQTSAWGYAKVRLTSATTLTISDNTAEIVASSTPTSTQLGIYISSGVLYMKSGTSYTAKVTFRAYQSNF